MKVYEQGNALIDALAEQYSAEDLPGALGDVLYDMLVRAADKGAGGHDLHEMLHAVTMRWDGQAAADLDLDDHDVPDITATCSVCGGSIAVCDRLDDEYVWYHYTPSNCDDPDVIPGTVVVNGDPLGAS